MKKNSCRSDAQPMNGGIAGGEERQVFRTEAKIRLHEHEIAVYHSRIEALKEALTRKKGAIRDREVEKFPWRMRDRILNRVVDFGVRHQHSKTVDTVRRLLWRWMPGLYQHLEKVRKRMAD